MPKSVRLSRRAQRAMVGGSTLGWIHGLQGNGCCRCDRAAVRCRRVGPEIPPLGSQGCAVQAWPAHQGVRHADDEWAWCQPRRLCTHVGSQRGGWRCRGCPGSRDDAATCVHRVTRGGRTDECPFLWVGSLTPFTARRLRPFTPRCLFVQGRPRSWCRGGWRGDVYAVVRTESDSSQLTDR